MKRIFKKIFVILLIILIVIVFIIFGLLITRNVKRDMIKKEYAIHTAMGIDQEAIVEIGGINQYLYIRGQNLNNPIILVLHGGPGSPMTPLLHAYQTPLEDNFTIVNYDQRNCGKTYYLNDPFSVTKTLSIDLMVEDVKEIVLYLKLSFEQEKIIILGHSWGSVLGTIFVQTYPELVEAYIGVGQVININHGDALAFEKTLAMAKIANNQNDINILENLEGYTFADEDFSQKSFLTLRKLMKKYLTPGLKDNLLWSLFISPYYSLKDLTFFLKPSLELQKPLMDFLAYDFDANNYGTNYQVPVFYILGDQDWITPYICAQDFFETIEAPVKELIIIENAGHMTMIDNNSSFSKAVLDVYSRISE